MTHQDDGGLYADLGLTGAAVGRRDALRTTALGALALLGCTKAAEPPASCDRIPEETAGPFPADGSNGPDVLSQTGVVRRNITGSFAGLTGTAEGVPLTIELQLLELQGGCEPAAGRAVYAWHCDRDALYSLYSAGATEQNYLRGVQEADANGELAFRTIFPGCHPGRWPHIHFEVFESLAAVADGGEKVATSQLAFPESACEAAYAEPGYESSLSQLQRESLDDDGVFRDGYSHQLATVAGDADSGFVARLVVAV